MNADDNTNQEKPVRQKTTNAHMLNTSRTQWQPFNQSISITLARSQETIVNGNEYHDVYAESEVAAGDKSINYCCQREKFDENEIARTTERMTWD